MADDSKLMSEDSIARMRAEVLVHAETMPFLGDLARRLEVACTQIEFLETDGLDIAGSHRAQTRALLQRAGSGFGSVRRIQQAGGTLEQGQNALAELETCIHAVENRSRSLSQYTITNAMADLNASGDMAERHLPHAYTPTAVLNKEAWEMPIHHLPTRAKKPAATPSNINAKAGAPSSSSSPMNAVDVALYGAFFLLISATTLGMASAFHKTVSSTMAANEAVLASQKISQQVRSLFLSQPDFKRLSTQLVDNAGSTPRGWHYTPPPKHLSNTQPQDSLHQVSYQPQQQSGNGFLEGPLGMKMEILAHQNDPRAFDVTIRFKSENHCAKIASAEPVQSWEKLTDQYHGPRNNDIFGSNYKVTEVSCATNPHITITYAD